MIKFSKTFGAVALLLAGCATPVGDSFTAFVNEDGAGAVFEGVIEVSEAVHHYRQVEGAAPVERVAIDIGGPKRVDTEVSNSKASRIETVTEVAELENGTRVYTEVKTKGTESVQTQTTVVDGEFGYTNVSNNVAATFKEFQAINRWDGTDGTGLVNIETLGGIDMLTLFLGRIAVLSGAGEGDAWDDAFDDYDDMFIIGEQAHVYSVESVGDGDATNGDGDDADTLTVKIRFAGSLLSDFGGFDEIPGTGSTQGMDDLVNTCLTIIQQKQSINYSNAIMDDDSIDFSSIDNADCPALINEATLTIVEDVITSAELSYVRVGIDENLSLNVAVNEDPKDTTFPTVSVNDPGYGYELIINCDNDGDSDPLNPPFACDPNGCLNPTEDVQCRFIADNNFGSATVGAVTLDFEDNQSQLKKYVHYNVTEGTVSYTLNKWTNPAE